VRIPLALIAWLIPLVLFTVWRGRTLAWATGGAFLYLVLFNLRYALLDQYAYSFSAIASPTGMALYIVGTALLALILAWLVALAGAGSFGQGARRAAEMTLALAAVILYLLSLPVAWSLALNGLTAAWILPDFASLFLAVLSAVQMVVVGLVGLVLAGLAALVGARLKLLRLMPQTH
jgi:hypothetical protein